MFFVNAVLFASLLPRLPDVKAGLGLSNTALGLALAAMPAAALAAGPFAPAVIRRLGSGRVASWGLVAMAGAVATIPAARSVGTLAVALAVLGAVDGAVDVAQNAQGLQVQRTYGRSIVHAFHGMWSLGAVAGGLLGSAAAGLDVALGAHLAVTSAAFAAVAVAVSPRLLRDAGAPAGPTGTHRRGGPVLVLAALGGLAVCGAMVEDAGGSWGAIYLRGEVGTGPAAAGLAFVTLQAAMTVGRFTGDRAVDRFGQRRVAAAGGLAVAGGLGAALALPHLAAAVAGFAAAGAGVATLIPAAMHAADETPGVGPGTGLAVVSWALRAGLLVSPAAVGAAADVAGLRVALLVVVAAGVAAAVLSRALPATQR